MSTRIEQWLARINQALPLKAWYAILGLTIFGNVFFANAFGPEINGGFTFLWLFCLAVVIFGEPKAPGDQTASYLGLFIGIFLLLVFLFFLIRSVLYYV